MNLGQRNFSRETDDSRSLAATITSLEKKNEELRARCDRLLAHVELIDNRLLRIETNRLFRVWNKAFLFGAQTLERACRSLVQSPFRWLVYRRNARIRRRSIEDYACWVSHEQAEVSDRQELSVERKRRPRISVVMVLEDWRPGFTDYSLQSILQQTYSWFELCISCSQAIEPLLNDFLARSSKSGSEVRIKVHSNDTGRAEATNATMALARGEYLLFFNPNDLMARLALHDIGAAIQDHNMDILYADEDQINSDGRRTSPVFKPGWSPDLLTSCMYLGSLLVVRRSLLLASGGLRTRFESAEFYDLALRLTEITSSVCRIPRVLYHRRAELASADRLHDTIAPEQMKLEKLSLQEAMERRGWAGTTVEADPLTATYSVRRPTPLDAALSIVICSKNSFLLRRCLESIRKSTADIEREILVVNHQEGRPSANMQDVLDAFGCKVVPYGSTFNFSAMNNLAAARAVHPFLLFVNDDVIFTSKNWAEHLLGNLQRPEIGVVGATLYYPSGTLQHAGVVLGMGDGAGHPGRFQKDSELWPWLTLTRNVSAVTGAFLGIRSDVFQDLGGFDSTFDTNYNDVDLCLRAGVAGYSIVCMAEKTIFHEESRTRKGVTRLHERDLLYARWGHLIARPDPFYSPNLGATERAALNLGEEPNPFEKLQAVRFDAPSRPGRNW